MSDISFNDTFDARGLMCPMPLVKSRQAIMKLNVGETLKIVATDKGSVKDFQGWAKMSKDVELLAQEEDTEGDKKLFVHFIKKLK